MMIKLTCNNCGKRFNRDIPAPKYCSKICINGAREKRYEEIRRKRRNKYGFIYFIQEEFSGAIKIGFTQEDVNKRLKGLQHANPNKLSILKFIEGSTNDEIELHKKFKKFRITGEWFKPSIGLMEYIKEKELKENE